MDTPAAPSGGPPASSAAGALPVVLATHELTKSFGGTLAVDRLSLTVRRGDIFGFSVPTGPARRRPSA